MTTRSRRAGAAACALVAAAVVVAVAVVAGVFPYRTLGLADPGAMVRVGAPLLRLLVDGAATVCAGALVFAAFFTRPQPTGVIGPAAFAALRTASRAAVVWSVAALVLWPFDVAATVGLPLRQVLAGGGLWAATGALEGPKAWLTTAGLALTVSIAGRRTLRWRATFGLVVLAVLATLPTITAGHSASERDHDLATAAIAVHIPAAVVWLGTLIAVRRARGDAAVRDQVLRRYFTLSAGCFWVVVLSGLADALVLAPDGSVFTSGFGVLVLAKLVVAGLAGYAVHRGRRRAQAAGKVLAAEVGALAAAFGLSVGLTNLPAPKFLLDVVTSHQTLLGYDLTVPPTAWRLLADWRIELLFGPLCLALAAAYLALVRRLGRQWPRRRTAAWLAGCGVLLMATSSGLGRYAPAMFSLEAVAHMLVGMLVPLLLTLGAPLQLADAALRPAPADGLPGPREWLESWRSARLTKVATQPVVATLVFIGAPFLLYFTALYDVTVRYHWAHLAMTLVFVVLGYPFMWTMAGSDPLPLSAPGLLRAVLLLVVMPVHIAFATAILNTGRIIGNGPAGANMYQALGLPWISSLAADQRLGAYLILAVGEAIMFALLVLVILRWRSAERGGDYEEMLDQLVRRRRSAGAAEAPQSQAVGHHEQ